FHEAGIKLCIFCMVGFPSETTDEMFATYRFVRENHARLFDKAFTCSFSNFVLDVGSDIETNLELYGLERVEVSGTPILNVPFRDPDGQSSDTIAGIRRHFNGSL